MSNKKDVKDLTLEEITEVFMDEDAQHGPLSEGQEPLDMGELQRKIRSGEVKVKFAPRLHVTDLEHWVDKVLSALGFSGAMVSDMSRVSDFSPEHHYIEEASDKLGFDINEREYIYQVAQRLKDKTEE